MGRLEINARDSLVSQAVTAPHHNDHHRAGRISVRNTAEGAEFRIEV